MTHDKGLMMIYVVFIQSIIQLIMPFSAC